MKMKEEMVMSLVDRQCLHRDAKWIGGGQGSVMSNMDSRILGCTAEEYFWTGACGDSASHVLSEKREPHLVRGCGHIGSVNFC